MSGISVEHILTRNLSEHLSTPVLLLDERGALIFFNEAAEVIVGRPHDDLVEVGADWPSLLHVVDGSGADLDSGAELAPLQGRAPDTRELRLRTAAGEVETYVAWTFPMIGRDGAYLGAIVSFWRDL